jgi:nitroimidazol reductase NimA-like FMN-containing flavoprotein (pyridoxamine 5'-phosphate oxidase superfamily)
VSSQAPTRRTRVRRHPERARYDRKTVFSILDEALICHLGIVDEGTPFVLPTMYAREREVIYIHGAPASRMLESARSGIDVCLTVTLLDGLVMARSVFSHSMNYRSVIVVGRAKEVTEQEEKLLASRALVEHVCRGRWAEARQPSVKELGATVILRLALSEASAKVRSGGPLDKDEDLALPVWAGEIPLRIGPLAPITHEAVPEGVEVPGYAEGYRRPGWDRAGRDEFMTGV